MRTSTSLLLLALVVVVSYAIASVEAQRRGEREITFEHEDDRVTYTSRRRGWFRGDATIFRMSWRQEEAVGLRFGLATFDRRNREAVGSLLGVQFRNLLEYTSPDGNNALNSLVDVIHNNFPLADYAWADIVCTQDEEDGEIRSGSCTTSGTISGGPSITFVVRVTRERREDESTGVFINPTELKFDLTIDATGYSYFSGSRWAMYAFFISETRHAERNTTDTGSPGRWRELSSETSVPFFSWRDDCIIDGTTPAAVLTSDVSEDAEEYRGHPLEKVTFSFDYVEPNTILWDPKLSSGILHTAVVFSLALFSIATLSTAFLSL